MISISFKTQITKGLQKIVIKINMLVFVQSDGKYKWRFNALL